MINNIFSQIDKLNDCYIDVWEDICNIESPSSEKKAVDRVGEYFIQIAKKFGWDIEVFEQQRFGNVVCITMNKNSKKQPIAISGHMDTVHPIGSFGSPAVTRDNEKLYGPGAMDCKGGVVAGFLAMHALCDCGFDDRPVKMFLQSNEEIGSGLESKQPIEYICKKAIDSVAFLNLEGYEDFFEGKACLIRKGIASFEFKINGIATHSSYCAKEGANAIAEAAHKILEIEKFKDADGITCSCNIITGGSSRNSVPANCSFKVDARFSTQEQYNVIIKRLKEIADTVYVQGCTCDMIQTNLRPAMELTEKNVDLLKKVNSLFTQSGFNTLEAGKRTGGSDAADITCCGIPCIDSLGVKGGRAHSTEEFGFINSLSESAKRIATIICGI